MLQLYMATDPKVVAGTVTVPFAGAPSAGQLTGTQVGAGVLNIAFAKQLAVAEPVSV
jgi:hypothetical protein